MTKEQQIIEIKEKVDAILREYSKQYEALADRSEKLYDEKEALKKEYEALDAKTGLNALYEELAKLIENK